MNKNFIEAILGAVVIIVACLFLIYGAKVGDIGQNKEGYVLYAEFSEIGGLKQGDDVRISGVKVGTVTDLSLQPDTYLARVGLMVNNNVKLSTDTASRVSSESLLGGAFLAVEPGASDEFLEAGGRIVYNQDAQNLETLLGQFIFSLKDAKPNE